MTSPDSSTPPPSDLLLAINGAEDRLQLALGRGGVLSLSQEWVVPGQAMQHLAPALCEAMARLGLELSELKGIACVRGPGSFTGLRLVLATALGLARAVGAPLAGIDYLPLLAAEPSLLAAGSVWVVTHARRGQVHIQGFAAPHADTEAPVPLSPPCAASLAEAAALIGAGPAPRQVLGSGVRRNAAFFESLAGQCRLLPPAFDHPRPQTLLACAARLEFGPQPVEPLYLRPSDAEENLDRIARDRGLDPDEARNRLERLTTS